MKKIYIFLLSGLVFFGFSNGYNCSTVNSRMDDFIDRYEDFTNRYDTHARVGQRVSNEYEASLRFEDNYKLQAEADRIDAEREVLLEEYDRCKEQDEKYKDYLRAGGKALKELQESDTYDSDLINKGITNYKKALDIAEKSKITTANIPGLKEQIAYLEDTKSERDAITKAQKDKEKKAQEEKTNNEKKNNSTTKENTSNTTTEVNNQSSTTQKKVVTKDEELSIAIQWMYDNGLTIYNQVNDFLPNDEITREQASKFFVEFAAKVLGKNRGVVYNYNIFSDLGNANPKLKDHIIYANNMGLFKGTNGKFKPFNKLTKAQAIAVTIRMANGYMDENINPRYLNYYYTADAYGILKWGGFEFDKLDSQNISRGDMALILYNLYLYLNK